MKNALILFLLAGILFQIPAYSQKKAKKAGAEAPEVKEESMIIIDGVEPGKATQDYDAALKYAEEKKLPTILIFTGSDWCGWCKIMDKNVFSKPEWAEYAKDNLVQVWIDFPKKNPALVPEKYRKRNRKLQRKYQVEGYPTYVVLDCTGNKVGSLGAGQDKTPESFRAELQKLLTMTPDGMKKFCSGLKTEDSQKVMKLFEQYSIANSKKNKLQEELSALTKEADDVKEELDQAILKSKLNAMTKEDRAEYEAAQKAVLNAQKELQEWLKINGQTKPTPQLRQEFNKLRKAIVDAQSKMESF